LALGTLFLPLRGRNFAPPPAKYLPHPQLHLGCNAAELFSRRQIRYSIEGSSISVMLAFKKN